RNTLLWCSQRFLVILACFQKGSKQSRMGLSIYLSYNGGLRPPVAGRMLSANRPVRASYHLYIMFPVSFPRWRQTPSITARRAVTHRGWHHSQPRGPSMSLHNLPCKLCSNDGSCGGMHAVLPPLTPTYSVLGQLLCNLPVPCGSMKFRVANYRGFQPNTPNGPSPLHYYSD